MPQRARQALVATILILYGWVSFFGLGLHAHPNDGRPHPSSDSSDCSLCKYLSQGQLATELAVVVSRPKTSPHVPLILALVATRDRHPSCSPRAPPTLLLNVA